MAKQIGLRELHWSRVVIIKFGVWDTQGAHAQAVSKLELFCCIIEAAGLRNGSI